MLVEPVGEAAVQVGTDRLGEGVVGGVADQQVAEAEPVVAGELGRSGRTSSRRTSAASRGRHLRLLRGERLHRAAVEESRPRSSHARARAAPPRRAGRAAPRATPSASAVRRRPRRLGRHRQHLRDEERVAARGVRDPLAQLVRPPRRRSAHRPPPRASGSQAHRRRPGRATLDQLRPRHAEQQERRAQPRAAPSPRPGRGTSPRPTGGRRRQTTSGACSSSSFRNAHAISSALARVGLAEQRTDRRRSRGIATAAPRAASPPRPPASR